MFITCFINLLLCLILDLLCRLPWQGWFLHPSFCLLFLVYLIFFRPLKNVLFWLMLYCFLLKPFTHMNIIFLGVTAAVVLCGFYFIRSEIYTESYLVKSLWTGLFILIFELALEIIPWGPREISLRALSFGPTLMNAALAWLLSIPIFMIWDFIFDFFGRDTGGGAFLSIHRHRLDAWRL